MMLLGVALVSHFHVKWERNLTSHEDTYELRHEVRASNIF